MSPALLDAPLRIAGILLGAVVLRWLVLRAVTGAVDRAVESSLHVRLAEHRGARLLLEAGGVLPSERRHQRARTIGSVLRSLASVVILGVALVMVLGELGVNLGPILAGAGVAGVALGFGAQSLVRDFLSGIFMILEDQYGVGDTIDAGPATGAVEAVGLRVTRLRDADGVVWYVRNGEILRVGNRSQGWSTVVLDVPVPPGRDAGEVRDLIAATATALDAAPDWDERILEAPSVEAPRDDEPAAVRVRLRCAPGEADAVREELLARLGAALGHHVVPRVPRSP